MSEEEAAKTRAEVEAAMEAERNRTRAGFPTAGADPDGSSGMQVSSSHRRVAEGPISTQRLSEEEREYLNNRLKALKGAPVSLLNRLDLQGMLQLNETLARESQVSGKLEAEAKLSDNYEDLISRPEPVKAGFDDRVKTLHACRFLGGAGCAAQTLWSRAREVLGNEGIPAISTYDMDAVGSGGSVTPKGWLEIHNPASLNMSLKHFHMANVGGDTKGTRKLTLADGDSSVEVGESAKEVTDMEEYKAALHTARDAMMFARPWDFSVAAIEGFMRISNFCSSDLGGRGNRGALLAAFTTYCTYSRKTPVTGVTARAL